MIQLSLFKIQIIFIINKFHTPKETKNQIIKKPLFKTFRMKNIH